MRALEHHKKSTGPSRCAKGSLETEMRSELLLPEPHALKPGVGLFKAPAVIALEDVRDSEHQIERAAVVTAAADGGSLQGIGELQEFQFSEPVALLKGSKGVVLLVGRELGGWTGQRSGRH